MKTNQIVKKEKTKVKIIIIAIALLITCHADAATRWIDDVDVDPYQPSITDLIQFNIEGRACNLPSWIEYDVFNMNGTSLTLDLYINAGNSFAISFWTYEKEIGTLNPGLYNLEVRAFDCDLGTLQDTYTMDFTVVPEPASLAVLPLGALILRCRRRHRQPITTS